MRTPAKVEPSHVFFPITIMKSNNNAIVADVFIVPNPAFRPASELKNELAIQAAGKLSSLSIHLKYGDKLNVLDCLEDKYVEVWIASPGNDQSNWSCHGIDQLDNKWFPEVERLPASLFDGKKEGDVVTFSMPIICKNLDDDGDDIVVRKYQKVSLCLKQKDYRYRSFGSFEEVLKMV